MHLSSASPRGGGRGPGLRWGNTGTLQQISALAVGEMWGLWGMPFSRGDCGDFVSGQLRDWERSIVRLIDRGRGEMAEEKQDGEGEAYVFLIGTNLEQRTNC